MTNSEPNSGSRLGADLYGLWRAGRDNLPTVAAVYSAAGDALDAAAVGVAGAFVRSGNLPGVPYGPAYQPWVELHNILAKICHDTADNIEATADALCVATVEYARADYEAASEFARLLEVNGEPRADIG
ncbi:hypothetical protein O7543_25240 [Solwaraspora sp. WMMA2080]|uniref:hypothetical protein n=1 Tax=unclassified Solwaraspora TaxID=2627926 RepID=UPI00248C9C43|nr:MULTISPECIES: hypothetical protein [unclassified Solwaraspora]WBB96026.1 hypothetical protein O7553_22135 [Solwaraspora sp. WMMA2059]WBC20069.1 hypothetical protein O7543_25240 [Solwaraspora sp. WMMA2080]